MWDLDSHLDSWQSPPKVRVPIIWVGHHQVGANHWLLDPLLHFPSYESVTIMSMRTFGSDTAFCIYDATCCGCWENPRGHNRGDLSRRRNGPNIHKGMTPPLTQNLKEVGLWVFFLIYCLTFSFLFNWNLELHLDS